MAELFTQKKKKVFFNLTVHWIVQKKKKKEMRKRIKVNGQWKLKEH